MLRQYSQFLINIANYSLGILRKYSRALYFLISAYVSTGAIMSPIITITIIEMIAVSLVDTMFYSA
jgi:hypothetical protein